MKRLGLAEPLSINFFIYSDGGNWVYLPPGPYQREEVGVGWVLRARRRSWT